LNGPLDTDYFKDVDTWISVAISLEPVPEPGTLVILISGGFFVLACIWRRRSGRKQWGHLCREI